MRKLLLLTALLAAAAAIAGCGAAADTSAGNHTVTGGATSTTPKTAATPVVKTTPAASPSVPASTLKPDAVSANRPVPAAELKDAFFADQDAWKGRTVSITGNYHSHTISTVSSGKIIRIDIADQTGKKVAACTVASAPTSDEVKERNNRIFKGTVKDSWFKQVLLEPCEMVK